MEGREKAKKAKQKAKSKKQKKKKENHPAEETGSTSVWRRIRLWIINPDVQIPIRIYSLLSIHVWVSVVYLLLYTGCCDGNSLFTLPFTVV